MRKITTLKRLPLHLDYFMDYKNRICQVLSWHHPQDRLLSIVKYIPGESYWKSRITGINYKRILKSYSLEGQQDNLENVRKFEKNYVYKSKVYGVNFLAVPISKITSYFYPEDRLREILNEKDRNDELETKVKVLAELIHDHMVIPFDDMGISGSIVWKAQTKKSDIDFMIYGNKHTDNFNEIFPVIYDNHPRIKPMNKNKTERYVRSMSIKSGLPPKLCEKYIKRKTWLGMFGDTNLSMLFSPKVNELPLQYGDEIYHPLISVDVECTIKNSELGSAYPGIYEIEDITLLTDIQKYNDEQIKRVLSFEGALIGYFKKGDRVVIRGLLEKVDARKTNEQFYQILLGTKECQGNEFILFKSDYDKLQINQK